MKTNKNKREVKVEWLKDTIRSFFSKKPESVISADKLVAEFALAFNSTERTGKEILKILSETGFIKLEKGEIRNDILSYN